MTTQEDTHIATWQSRLRAAVTTLTDAARQRRAVGAGTPSEHTEPDDFAECVCHAITATAANLGSIDALLAGRPGSWEADLIRNLVESTAGPDPENLIPWRTLAIHVPLNVDEVFYDFRIAHMYENDISELQERFETATSATLEAVATPEQISQSHQLYAAIECWDQRRIPHEQQVAVRDDAIQQHARLTQTILDRAAKQQHPTHVALAALKAQDEAIAELYARDCATYRQSFENTVREEAARLGAHDVAIDLVDFDPFTDPELDDDPDAYDPIAGQLQEYGLARTPLPMTGQPPDWTDGTPADALLRAHLTYTDRVTAAPTGQE